MLQVPFLMPHRVEFSQTHRHLHHACPTLPIIPIVLAMEENLSSSTSIFHSFHKLILTIQGRFEANHNKFVMTYIYDRYVSPSKLLSYWETIGITSGLQVLSDLGLSDKSIKIDLTQLSTLLAAELCQHMDILRWILL